MSTDVCVRGYAPILELLCLSEDTLLYLDFRTKFLVKMFVLYLLLFCKMVMKRRLSIKSLDQHRKFSVGYLGMPRHVHFSHLLAICNTYILINITPRCYFSVPLMLLSGLLFTPTCYL